MARPRKSIRRGVPRSVRFTEEEWARVCARAAVVGLSPGRFLREAALGHRLASRVNAQAIFQLGKAGTNLNQLARTANAIGRIEVSRRLDEVLAEVLEAVRRLSR